MKNKISLKVVAFICLFALFLLIVGCTTNTECGEYRNTEYSSELPAIVTYCVVDGNTYSGVIDTTGNYILSPSYHSVELIRVVDDEFYIVESQYGEYEVLDSTKSILVEGVYDFVSYLSDKQVLFLVKGDDIYFYDFTSKELYVTYFDEVVMMNNVMNVKYDGLWYEYDFNNKQLGDYSFTSMFYRYDGMYLYHDTNYNYFVYDLATDKTIDVNVESSKDEFMFMKKNVVHQFINENERVLMDIYTMNKLVVDSESDIKYFNDIIVIEDSSEIRVYDYELNEKYESYDIYQILNGNYFKHRLLDEDYIFNMSNNSDTMIDGKVGVFYNNYFIVQGEQHKLYDHESNFVESFESICVDDLVYRFDSATIPEDLENFVTQMFFEEECVTSTLLSIDNDIAFLSTIDDPRNIIRMNDNFLVIRVDDNVQYYNMSGELILEVTN